MAKQQGVGTGMEGQAARRYIAGDRQQGGTSCRGEGMGGEPDTGDKG